MQVIQDMQKQQGSQQPRSLPLGTATPLVATIKGRHQLELATHERQDCRV